MTASATAPSPASLNAVKVRRKLIEVALPLEAINVASAREKSIRHGHPSTLHLWWARRPLAAARAVIFAQMVDDPSEYVDELLADSEIRVRAEAELQSRRTIWRGKLAHQEEAAASGDVQNPDPGPEPTLEDCTADVERQRLFRLIEEFVRWENTTNESVLSQVRAELARSWRRTCADNQAHPRAAELFDPVHLPAFHDPFAGGGALPLEAQRLGLEAFASDLNPVAVLINKAMIEIPPRFAGCSPVNPETRADKRLVDRGWKGAQGLADDVHYYGGWMREQAEQRIGDLYPKVDVTAEMAQQRPDLKPYVGRSLTVIAWLWARTVKSPNPAFAHVDVPLASTFMLSTKAGKEAYVKPLIEDGAYRFAVANGKPTDPDVARNGTKLARGANFQCLMSGTPMSGAYIKSEGRAGRMGARLMAIVAEGDRERVYLPPMPEHEAAPLSAVPTWDPEITLPDDPRNFWTVDYGLTTFGALFTSRQLVALTTFSDLVGEARERVRRDAIAADLADDSEALNDGGTGVTAYADAVVAYLSLGVTRLSDRSSTLCSWDTGYAKIRNTFGRQALPMTWDYAEGNPLSNSTGNFVSLLKWIEEILPTLPATPDGHGLQADAASQLLSTSKVISTDPPYYDNIGYADLSDYFYIWLRRSLRTVFPDLFATLAVPKAEELVATPYRHGGKDQAEAFFLEGMTEAMRNLAEQAHPAFPVSIYYAFKQSEAESAEGTISTGWETFLGAVSRSGFAITGTWPMRTELSNRMISSGTNALASSIILVCRRRDDAAPAVTRREFATALKAEVPRALLQLQGGNIAPVDLQQAAIGPGMAVYTRYSKVMDAEGNPLSIRDALAQINRTLDEALAEQEGDFDADSRWALTWYEQVGFAEGDYGLAEQLSKSKNTSVAGMVEAGILRAGHGKVKLLAPSELDPNWDPATDRRRPAWQAVHQLIQAADGGEAALAGLIAKLGPEAENARELAYRLYVLSERKKRTGEALWYNGLVQSWPEASRLAAAAPVARADQGQLFEER